MGNTPKSRPLAVTQAIAKTQAASDEDRPAGWKTNAELDAARDAERAAYKVHDLARSIERIKSSFEDEVQRLDRFAQSLHGLADQVQAQDPVLLALLGQNTTDLLVRLLNNSNYIAAIQTAINQSYEIAREGAE